MHQIVTVQTVHHTQVDNALLAYMYHSTSNSDSSAHSDSDSRVIIPASIGGEIPPPPKKSSPPKKRVSPLPKTWVFQY